MSGPKPRGWYYFGCKDGPGHYLYDQRLNSAAYDHPLGKFDGTLCPSRSSGLYVAALTHFASWGFSALAFWDQTIDSRGGSNSIVFAPSPTIGADGILRGAHRFFPSIAKRWPEIDISKAEYRPTPLPGLPIERRATE